MAKRQRLEILIPHNEIIESIERMAYSICAVLEPPIQLVCVLEAADRFATELHEHVYEHRNLVYVKAKSYSGRYAGNITITPVSAIVPDTTVVIVDTIVDTGATSCGIKNWLKIEHGLDAYVAALFVREGSEEFVDFYDTILPKDQFVVGYGLDYNGNYRDLDDVYVLSEDP